MIKEFFIPKKTGAYADALVAMGQADLLRNVQTPTGNFRRVRIIDVGDSYRLEVSPGITEEDILSRKLEPGYIYIKIKNDDPDVPPPGYPVFEYEAEREKEKVYREFQKNLEKKTKKINAELELQGLETPIPPPPELPIIKTYNSMRMGSNKYNSLHKALRQAKDLSKLVMSKLGIEEYQESQSEEILKKAVANLQIFNPVSGKGTHRPKPDSSSASGFSDKLVDWFEEWMKFRAMHLGLLTYPVGDDTKIMVLAPADIGIGDLAGIHENLLKERLFGSIWLDIQALFSTVELLIKQSEEFQEKKGQLIMARRSPNQIIKGFYSTYFKSLGTASAVMNISFLGLPGWFPVNNRQDALDWLDIIEEHRKCLQSLNESHSSDVPLLLLYRDFLSTGELKLGLEFFAGYGIHFMQRKAQNKWAKAFTTVNLGRLFMSYNAQYSLKEIIKNDGFQSIAKAIRKATISAQLRKSITGKSPFEIQYGLAQDWKRKVKYKDQFIIELADFVQRYNAENARHAEQKKEPRKSVTTDDLNQVLDLIEKHSSELVGMLLLAYGYAREPQEQDDSENNLVQGG